MVIRVKSLAFAFKEDQEDLEVINTAEIESMRIDFEEKRFEVKTWNGFVNSTRFYYFTNVKEVWLSIPDYNNAYGSNKGIPLLLQN